jgi:hypothetical protein
MTPEQIRAWLAFELEPLLTRRDEVLAALTASLEAAPTIENQTQLTAYADNLKMAKAILKTADTRRTEVKRPFLDGGREIDAWFKGVTSKLDEPVRAIERIMGEYQARLAREARERAEAEARRLREEAEAKAAAATAALFGDDADAEEDAGRGMQAVEDAQSAAQRAEVAQKLADGTPGDLVRATSDLGTTVTAQERLEVVVVDATAVPRQFLVPDERAIKDFIAMLAKQDKAGLRAKLERGEQPVAGVQVTIIMKPLVR